jgi:hypothetical protein
MRNSMFRLDNVVSQCTTDLPGELSKHHFRQRSGLRVRLRRKPMKSQYFEATLDRCCRLRVENDLANPWQPNSGPAFGACNATCCRLRATMPEGKLSFDSAEFFAVVSLCLCVVRPQRRLRWGVRRSRGERSTGQARRTHDSAHSLPERCSFSPLQPGTIHARQQCRAKPEVAPRPARSMKLVELALYH